MSKFTPGPWKSDWGTIYSVTSGCLDKEIGAVNHHRPEYEANARLIAASPDLLAAVRSAKDFLREIGDFGECPIREELNAAITKATGEGE